MHKTWHLRGASGRAWFDHWFRHRVIQLPTKKGRFKPYQIRYASTEHGKYKPQIERCFIELIDGRMFWVSFGRAQQHPELWVLHFDTKEPEKSVWVAPQNTASHGKH